MKNKVSKIKSRAASLVRVFGVAFCTAGVLGALSDEPIVKTATLIICGVVMIAVGYKLGRVENNENKDI